MDIKILNSYDYKKTEWSGGTTTELFIHPEQAVFKSGEYDFRLSIATIEIEESVFTELEGVARTLMILEGEVTLAHEGQHSKKLKKFESDQFSGDWLTKCTGTCTDFNLMTKGKTSGILTPLINDGKFKIKLDSNFRFTFLYLHKGLISTSIDKVSLKLNKQQLMVIHSPKDTELTFDSMDLSELIRIDIK